MHGVGPSTCRGRYEAERSYELKPSTLRLKWGSLRLKWGFKKSVVQFTF